jgi:hypothetical protein
MGRAGSLASKVMPMLVPRAQRSRRSSGLPPSRNARLSASIVYDHKQRPCVVRSVTGTEARIEVVPVGDVPNRFDLVVPGDGTHHCRVIWRALREIGVAFSS